MKEREAFMIWVGITIIVIVFLLLGVIINDETRNDFCQKEVTKYYPEYKDVKIIDGTMFPFFNKIPRVCKIEICKGIESRDGFEHVSTDCEDIYLKVVRGGKE